MGRRRSTKSVRQYLMILPASQPTMVSDSAVQRAMERWRRVLAYIAVPPRVMIMTVVE
jgi:hypothetical protein